MSLTPTQLVERRAYLGASDIPAILGLSPWRSSYDVWLDKTGQSEPWEGNDKTDLGNRLEPIVLGWASEQLGALLPSVLVERRDLHLGANCDALVAATGQPVECKTSGIAGRGFPEEWGPDYTDEVPEFYYVQVHAQLVCTESDLCWLAALLGGRGFAMFRIERSQSLCEAIVDESGEWWHRHIERGIPPEDSAPSIATAKRIRKVAGKTVVNPALAPLVATYEERRMLRMENDKLQKAFRESEEEALAVLIAAMGDAEALDFGDPSRVLTYKEQVRRAYTVEETRYRVARFREGEEKRAR